MDAGLRQVIFHRTKRGPRTAKSQGPGAATVASIHAGPCRRGNGDNKTPLTGATAYKPSNHCAGKAGLSRLYLSNPCAFLSPLHTAMRVHPAPGFPCALPSREGQRDCKTRAKTCRGNVSGCSKAEAACSAVVPYKRVERLSAVARRAKAEARYGTHNHRKPFCEGCGQSSS